MQRVATELHSALKARPDVLLADLLLHSSWRWTHLKTGPFLARSLHGIRELVSSGQIDAVLFSSMVTAALAIPLRKTLRSQGVIAAAIVHGRDVTMKFKPYQRLVPRVFDALDAVLPVSRATGDACEARGLDPSRMFVIPNGVEVGRFRKPANRSNSRADLLTRFEGRLKPVPPGVMLLCSVGRQVKRKGFVWFVDNVLPLLPEDVHYWLAGDGPEAESIAEAARQRGIRHRIGLLGRIAEKDLELLYSAADLFIMPNVPVDGDMEGFGVVMLEAGLSGLPTIGSRLEGITDVIEEGENGHLVATGDAWSFSEAVMRYYHDPEALSTARKRAVDYVAAHFGWDAVAATYAGILSDAIRSSRPRKVVLQERLA
ncbi:MAG: glycosyltransferase family 4 protein [Rhodothermales bacterium]